MHHELFFDKNSNLISSQNYGSQLLIFEGKRMEIRISGFARFARFNENFDHDLHQTLAIKSTYIVLL